MANISGVIKITRLAGDQELFRRNSFNHGLIARNRATDTDVIACLGRLHLQPHFRCCCTLLNRFFFKLNDLYVMVLRKQSNLCLIEISVFRFRNLSIFGPAPLDDARLSDKCILKRTVENRKTGVITIKDIVNIICLLSSQFNRLSIARSKFNNIFRRRKDTKKRRHDGLHRVAHFSHNNLGSAFLFVAEGVAAIILRRKSASRSDEAVDIIHGIIY